MSRVPPAARTRSSIAAPERKPERAAHVAHPGVAQLAHAAPHVIFRHGHDVMQIDRARLLETTSGPMTTSDGTPRIVEVIGAIVTRDSYPMAESRVRISTGRALSGAGRLQRRISLRAIRPAMPRPSPTCRTHRA